MPHRENTGQGLTGAGWESCVLQICNFCHLPPQNEAPATSPRVNSTAEKEYTTPNFRCLSGSLGTGLLIPPLKGKLMRMAALLAGQDLDVPAIKGAPACTLEY